MRDWLAYSVVFGFALATATGGYFAGFTKIMTGVSHGIEGFLLNVVALPLLAATVVFGVTSRAIAKRVFPIRTWVIAAVVIAGAATVAFALLYNDVVDQRLAMLLLLSFLFAGGRVMFGRADHV